MRNRSAHKDGQTFCSVPVPRTCILCDHEILTWEAKALDGDDNAPIVVHFKCKHRENKISGKAPPEILCHQCHKPLGRHTVFDMEKAFHVDPCYRDYRLQQGALDQAHVAAHPMRTFDTGATRDVAEHKHDYRGFFSVEAMRAFGAYMHEHRLQADGSLRDSDNWKKGMPDKECLSSLFRHFMDVYEMMDSGKETVEDFDGNEIDLKDALCAMLFNVQILLHQHLKQNDHDV